MRCHWRAVTIFAMHPIAHRIGIADTGERSRRLVDPPPLALLQVEHANFVAVIVCVPSAGDDERSQRAAMRRNCHPTIGENARLSVNGRIDTSSRRTGVDRRYCVCTNQFDRRPVRRPLRLPREPSPVARVPPRALPGVCDCAENGAATKLPATAPMNLRRSTN